MPQPLLELLQWWQLPFVLPFLVSLGYTLLMATGMATVGHDTDVEVDHDVGVGADFDHDAEVGVEHSTEFSHHGHESGESGSALMKIFSVLGVGKTPISIIFTTFCFVWSFTGYAANMLLAPIFRVPEVYFWISAGIAAFVSVVLTGRFAKLLGRLIPSKESYATREGDLVGRTGSAVSELSGSFGRVQVYDSFRNLHEVMCVVPEGQDSIARGSEIVLVSYDRDKSRYTARLAQNSLAVTR
jgi:membrane protein implicated in regulation of membrane protease activity